MSLTATIKSIQDIMRKDVGVDGDAQRIGQLGWMLFYKIFSDQDAELESSEDNYESPIPAELRWDEWADSKRLGKNAPTGNDLLELIDGRLFPQLKTLEVDELEDTAKQRSLLLRSVFEDAYNYMKSGTLLRDCNLHTIVRLPNGVFSPYTSIRTNVLFFTKGEPTTEVWYYEHPYPPGYKSYSKTKPMTIQEFEPEKAWWHNRTENEFAWSVPVETIIANGYNLDIKNPNAATTNHEDPLLLLKQYQEVAAAADRARGELKAALQACLEKS